MEIEVVGISFQTDKKIYMFSTNGYQLKKNVTVIVEGEKGLMFGKVVIESKVIIEKDKNIYFPKVVRIASKQDFENHRRNQRDSEKALEYCREKVKKLKLNMRILSATYTYDRRQLLFQFVSEERVDFRELAKDLAAVYRTRIELRQIGIRDKAKWCGGYGVCGRELCCAKFLESFESVSINQAKNQNIALNPSKINGVCGRLMCCLNYEDEEYTNCRSLLPHLGEVVKIDGKEGRVVSLNICPPEYVVEFPNKEVKTIQVECHGSHK